ncbi:sodium:solute symporter family protein [Pseudomonas sp. No.21]|uniref:sodium:solute symporter family protein n=1 Tax=Pseudomonas TaxID=286 RepID=UPI000DAAABFD|nr:MULTISPECIES: sodium:solute symporter family protein [Pseudomonas]MDW3714539.1 sodium:solute symporter family protein [Pseudomonas sp. 2023EL-01195]PZE12352.1 sodium:solute symporter [Pseudomonas sp. 57B-090624]GJN44023.1 sodium:solute symporter [Pseudomonas tohonis]
MLIWFVAVYLLITVGVGFYASTRVKNSKDFAAGGRSMSFPLVAAMVFATWFGSEAVLGIPATFIEEGFAGIIEDPFGSFGCLMLVGLVFARPLYRMNLLTIGDFFKKRFGPNVELITSLVIIGSYLGWVAAQLTALGVVFNVLSDGSITTTEGMLIGTGIVLLYTLFGGMWSVALTDFMQMIIIVAGLLYLTWLIGDMAGGPQVVISHAASEGRFAFMHGFEPRDIVAFLGAAVTMMFGSIPQQDVYARVMSAKTENIAARASMAGACFYLGFCMLPIFLTYAASMIDPAMVQKWLAEDAQMILPHLIMERTPLFAQVMFFGALLSAIMSTASGTLLAPSVTFTENVLKRFLPDMNDRQFLLAMRLSVLGMTVATSLFALYSDASIYEMVGNAYKVTLVAAVVPLFAGLFWKRATTQGALVAIGFGLASWVFLEMNYQETDFWPPQLAGLLFSVLGMLLGSLLPQLSRPRGESADAMMAPAGH